MNWHPWVARAAAVMLWAMTLAALGMAWTATRSTAAAADEATTRDPAGVSVEDATAIATVGGVAEAAIVGWLLDSEVTVGATATLDIDRTDDEAWNVVVAAAVTPPADPTSSPSPQQRFYQATVDADGQALIGAPAQIAAPSLTSPMPVDGGDLEELPTDAAETIAGFVEGLLAGGQALDRYVTTDAQITQVTPPAYETVDIDWVHVVASDGADALVVLEVTGNPGTGPPQTLHYALELRRGTRWEVAAISHTPIDPSSRSATP